MNPDLESLACLRGNKAYENSCISHIKYKLEKHYGIKGQGDMREYVTGPDRFQATKERIALLRKGGVRDV